MQFCSACNRLVGTKRWLFMRVSGTSDVFVLGDLACLVLGSTYGFGFVGSQKAILVRQNKQYTVILHVITVGLRLPWKLVWSILKMVFLPLILSHLNLCLSNRQNL